MCLTCGDDVLKSKFTETSQKEAGELLVHSYPKGEETRKLEQCLIAVNNNWKILWRPCSIPVEDKYMEGLFGSLKTGYSFEIDCLMTGIAASCAAIDTTTDPICPTPPIKIEQINQSKYRENLASVLLNKRDVGSNTLLHLAIGPIARSAKKTSELCIIIII
jgi:hypothetical protein